MVFGVHFAASDYIDSRQDYVIAKGVLMMILLGSLRRN